MSILPVQKWIPVTFWQLEEWALLAFGLETSPEVFSVIYCIVAFKTDYLRIFFLLLLWLACFTEETTTPKPSMSLL